MSELQGLIERLERTSERPDALGFVKDYGAFITILKKINALVGLSHAKTQVARQIKLFAFNYKTKNTITDGRMLHTLLCGPPGCGKSTLGKLLAEMWAASGCLSKDKPSPSPPQPKKPDSPAAVHINNALTLVNNTRRKVRPLPKYDNKKIQAQFQAIKENLRQSAEKIKEPTIGDILPIMLRTIDARDDSRPTDEHPFLYLTRGDLIGKYQGHTADIVRKKIKEAKGGVIMIDEAYELCNSENDTFGREALTEIAHHMWDHPDDTIFIFAGYRNRIENTILKMQEGLARRLGWSFDLAGYTAAELGAIFRTQLAEPATIDERDLVSFFTSRASHFPYFAGDTKRFADDVGTVVASKAWDAFFDGDADVETLRTVTMDDVRDAFAMYKKNAKTEDETADTWRSMYA